MGQQSTERRRDHQWLRGEPQAVRKLHMKHQVSIERFRILRKGNSDSEYEMLDSRLNPHLFIGIVNASVVDSKEKETGRLGR